MATSTIAQFDWIDHSLLKESSVWRMALGLVATHFAKTGLAKDAATAAAHKVLKISRKRWDRVNRVSLRQAAEARRERRLDRAAAARFEREMTAEQRHILQLAISRITA